MDRRFSQGIVFFDLAAGRSLGVDELRWLKPVRPGDELSMYVEVLEALPSRTKLDRGLVKLRYTTRNQNGEDVMAIIALSRAAVARLASTSATWSSLSLGAPSSPPASPEESAERRPLSPPR